MRIYKRGKCWYIDYFYKGHRTRKKVGQSKKVAELTLKDIELKIAKGEHLGIHETKKVLFKDFALEYLNFSKANKAPKSYGRDIISLKTNLIPYFKENHLTDITAQSIEEYKLQRLNKVSPATVNRELACLKHLFSKAVEWEYCDINPVKKVKFLREPPGRIRYLETYEIQSLLRECSPHIKPVVIIALGTGMRKSEILNLKWKDVSLRERIIIVRNSKNNESRIIPMNEMVYNALRNLYTPENIHIFHTKNVRKGFEGASKRAGIENFTFHDLRHTFASHLVMAGCDIRTVQQLLGHKDLRMTMRYANLSKSHLQGAVNLLDKKLSEFGTNLAQSIFSKKPKPINT